MTDQQLLALHGLAIKKASATDAVATAVGLPAEAVGAALDVAVADGRVLAARGMFILTPAGRSWLDERYPVEFADVRANPAASAAYHRFEKVNRAVLDLMTRWQSVSRGGTTLPNDHSDPEYDERILEELADLHVQAEPILAAFVALVPRLVSYPDQLGAALVLAQAGETDYVSGARIPSYHTVWFEMHEDLLRILGRSRED